MRHLLCTFFFLFIMKTAVSQELRIATYNIRFDHKPDTTNAWEKRKDPMIGLIQYHNMDIIGTQEGLHHQLEDLKSGLGFPYVGVARDDGKQKGEYSAIFYNSSKFSVIETNTFWLSDSPDKPSVGWDAAMERICTWALFEQKENGRRFYVFNVHYDHVGQKAREQSSRLLMEDIKSKTGKYPVILLGDFNVEDDNPAYKHITDSGIFSDAKLVSKSKPYGTDGTFNAFNWNRKPYPRIDYIFVSTEIEVLTYAVITDHYGLKYPSDHFPVVVKIAINP